jgi:hypothetical protein
MDQFLASANAPMAVGRRFGRELWRLCRCGVSHIDDLLSMVS